MFLASLFTVACSFWDGSCVHIHARTQTFGSSEVELMCLLDQLEGKTGAHAAGTRLQVAGKHRSADTVSSHWSHLAPPCELQTVCEAHTQLPYQRLQATESSEVKNMLSVTFVKTTWHVRTSGDLEYFRQALCRHFTVLLCFFNPSHRSLQLFRRLLQCLFLVKLQQCFVD